MKNIITSILLSLFFFTGCLSGKRPTITDEEKEYAELSQIQEAVTHLSWKLHRDTIAGITRGTSYDEVLSILGQPDSLDVIFWEKELEIHTSLTYYDKGISVDMVGFKDEEKTVNLIMIVPPSTYKTNAGIGIGSTREEVEKAYSGLINDKYFEGNSIVIGSHEEGTYITFDADDRVLVLVAGSAK